MAPLSSEPQEAMEILDSGEALAPPSMGGESSAEDVLRALSGELRGPADAGAGEVEAGVDAPTLTPAIPAPGDVSGSSEPGVSTGVAARARVTEGQVRQIVQLGTLAPSAANMQPWRFVWRPDGHLDCMLDVARSGSLLDFQSLASYASIGAAVENMSLAARGLGLDAEVEHFPQSGETTHVCTLHLRQARAKPSSGKLLAAIPQRTTNRRLSQRSLLSKKCCKMLCEAAASAGAQLDLITSEPALAEIGAVLAEVDLFRFFTRVLHEELMSEIRWTPKEAASTRDGVDISTLDMARAEAFVVRMASNWPVACVLRYLGLGHALRKQTQQLISTASAVGQVTIDGTGPEAYFRGGRAMERVWLAATACGLGIQPVSVMPYVFARVERGQGEGFDTSAMARLKELRDRSHRVLAASKDRAEVLLFRIVRAEPPSVRALRRPIEEVLETP